MPVKIASKLKGNQRFWLFEVKCSIVVAQSKKMNRYTTLSVPLVKNKETFRMTVSVKYESSVPLCNDGKAFHNMNIKVAI